MISRSTLLHLRFSFSVFLMPVFVFALSQAPQANLFTAALVFICLHVLVYPASNGFNSYYDRDKGSIGGLETPPVVKTDLLWTSLTLDAIALVLALYIGVAFAAGILLYGLVSKLYSHPITRLKKYPWVSWLTVAVFQGGFIYSICWSALKGDFSEFTQTMRQWQAAALATCLLAASYPITQVYQHTEDRERGDKTLSLLLGVKGTFWFTGILFMLLTAGFYYYLTTYYSSDIFVLFIIILLPVVLYFLLWFFAVFKNEQAANFRRTMRLNLLSCLSLSAFFAFLFWLGRV